VTATLAGVALGVVVVALAVGSARASASQEAALPPVFAYYYIWFDESSWDRAKRDLPQLGRYSSDSPEIMREHIKQAQEAGIDAFLVSWKSTEVLNRRLETLIEVAREEQFKLGIVYQALDFERLPLPVEQISADLDFFSDRFGGDPVFGIYDAPLVIIGGTWEFSPEQIASLVGQHREAQFRGEDPGQAGRLVILASERSPEYVGRLTGLVDGNAYYWSSVDPRTHPDYPGRLAAMREAVRDGIWIAPAAPGFDARLIGGSREVARLDGDMLRTQLQIAVGSDPDAIGIISWNEFTENTHIEASVDHGSTALSIVAEFTSGAMAPPGELIPRLAAPAAQFDAVDSSGPPGRAVGAGGVLAVLGLGALVVGGLAASMRRARRSEAV
jgi:hypothetical protein